MRSRPLSDEHRAVATRRLELLAHELEATRVRERPPPGPDEHTRIAAPAPAPAPVPAPVPAPGRHAARRAVPLVPDTLRGRVALGPTQFTVVAVLVAAGLAVTAWWVLRGDPEPAPAVPTVLATPAAATPEQLAVPSDSPIDAGSVTVDVAGKVRQPGIVVLAAGARVVDALEAAGGARRGVDLASLNLARVLVDGEQIVVGEPAAAAPPVPSGTVPGAPAPLVDLNLADQAELETLPGVGPVTAAAIIAWRDEHGGFTAVPELLEVDGIGEKTLADLTPLVTV
jgi:competence protein ComEA